MIRWAAVAVLAVLAGCAPQRGDPLKPPEQDAKTAEKTRDDAKIAAAAAAAPHIYMALQPSGAGPLSIVFVIDAGRDGSPGNDPAIRLTPEEGKCNPQELRRFEFPPGTGGRPIFGPDEASAGVTAQDLPRFMAMAVTSEMLRQGAVAEVEDSQPQNVCTRKLWERLIVNESVRTG